MTRASCTHIRTMSLAGGGAIDPDTFVGEPSYRAALHAAGGACEMTRALLMAASPLGFCGVRPSGHHAEPARAMGFCLFNNVAIAAELAIRELGRSARLHPRLGRAPRQRHRRGVPAAQRRAVREHPPGAASTRAPAPSATRARGRARASRSTCPCPRAPTRSCGCRWSSTSSLPAAEAFEPELVLVSAGFDAHRADPLADCRLETELLRGDGPPRARPRARGSELRSALVLEGGYAPVRAGRQRASRR